MNGYIMMYAFSAVALAMGITGKPLFLVSRLALIDEDPKGWLLQRKKVLCTRLTLIMTGVVAGVLGSCLYYADSLQSWVDTWK